MQTESLGKLLPRILFPYAQQWAERSGMSLLSRLLVDEQFRGLLEKYGDELVTRMTHASGAAGNGKPPSGLGAHASDLRSLQDRVLAMEAQQEAQQALFESLRTKIRPLALALGCCPECFVGVQGCPRCWGRSMVAHYPPDYTLLETQIVRPLVARGVRLVLSDTKVSETGRQSRQSTETRKRSKSWQKK